MTESELEGLTFQQKEVIRSLELDVQGVGQKMARWMRVLWLLIAAFEELKVADYATFVQLSAMTHGDQNEGHFLARNFLSAQDGKFEYLRSEEQLPDTRDWVSFGPAFPGSHDLRERMIYWMGNRPSCQKIRQLLEDAQQYWPRQDA